MPLIEAKELYVGEQKATIDISSESWFRAWHVYSDNTYTARSVLANVVADLALPGYLSTSGSLSVTKASIDCLGAVMNAPSGVLAHYQWMYKVEYGTPTSDVNDDPEDDEPDIEWGGIDEDWYENKDVDGAAIINSTGDFYENIPPKKRPGGEVTIGVNISSNPASICTNFSNTTSSGNWYGVPEGNAIMGIIKSRYVRESRNGTTRNYWKTSFPIRFNRNGFRFKPLDAGYHEKISGKRRLIKDDQGQPIAQPALLDGSGTKLSLGGTPIVFPADGYKMSSEADWSSLPIPNPFI